MSNAPAAWRAIELKASKAVDDDQIYRKRFKP
jgi:hypothetical protein